jgi:hypothetical protein
LLRFYIQKSVLGVPASSRLWRSCTLRVGAMFISGKKRLKYEYHGSTHKDGCCERHETTPQQLEGCSALAKRCVLYRRRFVGMGCSGARLDRARREARTGHGSRSGRTELRPGASALVIMQHRCRPTGRAPARGGALVLRAASRSPGRSRSRSRSRILGAPRQANGVRW